MARFVLLGTNSFVSAHFEYRDENWKAVWVRPVCLVNGTVSLRAYDGQASTDDRNLRRSSGDDLFSLQRIGVYDDENFIKKPVDDPEAVDCWNRSWGFLGGAVHAYFEDGTSRWVWYREEPVHPSYVAWAEDLKDLAMAALEAAKAGKTSANVKKSRRPGKR